MSRFVRTWLIGLGLATTAPAIAQDVGSLGEELTRGRDDAPISVVHEMAGLQSREAMQFLAAWYKTLDSVGMRREVVRAMAQFDGIKGAEQDAMDLVATVAASAPERELRDAALETLGASPSSGRRALELVIERAAQEEVREEALRLHCENRTEDDLTFYRRLYEAESDLASSGRGKKNSKSASTVAGAEVSVRVLAFQAMAPDLDDSELREAFEKSHHPGIRRAVLDELLRRDAKGTDKLARDTFERVNASGADRSHAAEILAHHHGPKVAGDLIEMARKEAPTPELLRQRIAEALVQMNDPGVNRKLGGLIGKGKPHEKTFALRATRHLDDPKLVKKIRKGLTDKDPDVRRVAAQVLAARRDQDSIEPLEKMLARPKAPSDSRAAIEALNAIRAGDPEWTKQLAELVQSEDRDVRNAALGELSKDAASATVPVLIEQLHHDDWTTRWISVQALTRTRNKAAVGAMIERMKVERGRLLSEFGRALFQLTGQPFHTDIDTWQRWWTDHEAGFEVISEADLEQTIAEAERRRLRQTTDARFFGVRIESERVIFVIDVSGSMVEMLESESIEGQNATRMDVVKREITKTIEALDSAALFNLITFNSAVTPWLKEGIAASTGETRAKALEYVSRLGNRGGTNIYDAMKAAFEDVDVDTIFLLSDGEPTAGAIVDPHRIREEVARWNEHRGVVIHTVAVGTGLSLLEWLAEDGHGTYVRFN